MNKRFHWPHDFFSPVKSYRIHILIGYTIFLTSEENRIAILLTTCCYVGKGAKKLFGFYVKK